MDAPTCVSNLVIHQAAAVWVGVLSACFAVAPLILAVPSGHAVDRFGERRAMLVDAALVAMAAAAFVLVGDGVAGPVAASVLLGTGHLCTVVGQQAPRPAPADHLTGDIP